MQVWGTGPVIADAVPKFNRGLRCELPGTVLEDYRSAFNEG